MTKIDICDTQRNNLIAAALGLQQCTRTDGTEVLVPGTDKRILIGNDAYLARVVAPASADNPSTAGAANIRGLERYDVDHLGGAFMQERPYGDYVKFSDVERLLAAPASQAPAQVSTAAEVRDQALNGIPATHRHDEGAIARCSYCGRYSLDPATLSDRQPMCDCGKQHGWCGSFKRPTADSRWSGKAPEPSALGEKGGDDV